MVHILHPRNIKGMRSMKRVVRVAELSSVQSSSLEQERSFEKNIDYSCVIDGFAVTQSASAVRGSGAGR